MPFDIHRTTAYDGTRHYSLTHTHVVSPVETDLGPDIPYDLNINHNDATRNQSQPWEYSRCKPKMAAWRHSFACRAK